MTHQRPREATDLKVVLAAGLHDVDACYPEETKKKFLIIFFCLKGKSLYRACTAKVPLSKLKLVCLKGVKNLDTCSKNFANETAAEAEVENN